MTAAIPKRARKATSRRSRKRSQSRKKQAAVKAATPQPEAEPFSLALQWTRSPWKTFKTSAWSVTTRWKVATRA